jgi:hypothetical protein
MINTIAMSAYIYCGQCILLTIIGEYTLYIFRPRKQSKTHYDYYETDEDNVRRPHIRNLGRCVAKIELANVHTYTANLDILPWHGDDGAIGC